MKKITQRAISVLLIAAMVIVGMVYYVIRYIDKGQDWALYFSAANSGSTGEILDRNGSRLAYFDSTHQLYSENQLTRLACYHVTGDYWGRTGSGVLKSCWNDLQGFSLITGTTQATDSSMSLSIDTELCELAYKALGDRNGAVMLENYKTGEILCLVSTPAVDPLDPSSEVPHGAYINRCLAASFTPGSVFKLITAAAAIENIPNLYSRQFYCEKKYDIAGVTITCSGTHYTQTFDQALANSCNVAFAQLAVMLGQDTMIEYVKKYGFLDNHKLDELKTAAGTYPLEFVGDPETAWSGIGQSVDLICPYTMLRYVAAIANNGTLVEPTLILDDDAQSTTQLMAQDTAVQMKSLMEFNVTAHYDGYNNFPGLNIGAKTGTAELGDGDSHAWFTGFLDDPDHPYAFVVLVERGGYGLSTAGPIANQLLQKAVEKY